MTALRFEKAMLPPPRPPKFNGESSMALNHEGQLFICPPLPPVKTCTEKPDPPQCPNQVAAPAPNPRLGRGVIMFRARSINVARYFQSPAQRRAKQRRPPERGLEAPWSLHEDASRTGAHDRGHRSDHGRAPPGPRLPLRPPSRGLAGQPRRRPESVRFY